MAALDAAVEKQKEWAATPPNDRAGILLGKPVAESKAEIIYAADFFRCSSGEALRIEGKTGSSRTAPPGCW
jgi:succinate-semialdehyde dehydrogenase/glutarate-semialdehyde dehydrogenase